MLYVVGVGAAKGYLTDRAKEIISKAEVVYGSERAIEYAKEFIRGEIRVLKKFGKDVYEEIEREAKDKKVVVLSTGDPMVSGLGKKINGIVEPGISSVQLALAKLRVDLCEVVVVDSHGKDSYDEIEKALEFRGKVLVLADKNFDLSKVKGRVIVLENLGLEDERVGEDIKSDLAIVYVER
ncbi:precorrin-6y C5,15-methyltransferase (decarboxylating), CbiE subunit [Ferroglobus placidus DSM 10642]|uniref:Precorrin-6y C5,15-methyltransferase (Decarboxylating), CbiE subunit n=1 Tax=Ferroglobus placidus (strain DSM 10642 / AEDII12DO) TaxID=589924 RepID=D3S1E0_FERPA|nr:cobalt-precorrin-7 (C(5))-methyltransferase [Ferroglobus placidus]ADC66404.1 precorrin-6y C5,15-methyltransferase (decarboxylating), CbiE subunit [Ferroglobus placidus DSM 10642]